MTCLKPAEDDRFVRNGDGTTRRFADQAAGAGRCSRTIEGLRPAARARPRFVLASSASMSSPGPTPMRAKDWSRSASRGSAATSSIARLIVLHSLSGSAARSKGCQISPLFGGLAAGSSHCERGVSLYLSWIACAASRSDASLTAVRTWRNAHGGDDGGSAVTPAGSEPFRAARYGAGEGAGEWTACETHGSRLLPRVRSIVFKATCSSCDFMRAGRMSGSFTPLQPRTTGRTRPSWTVPQTGMSLILSASTVSGLSPRIVRLASLPGTTLPMSFSIRNE